MDKLKEIERKIDELGRQKQPYPIIPLEPNRQVPLNPIWCGDSTDDTTKR